MTDSCPLAPALEGLRKDQVARFLGAYRDYKKALASFNQRVGMRPKVKASLMSECIHSDLLEMMKIMSLKGALSEPQRQGPRKFD